MPDLLLLMNQCKFYLTKTKKKFTKLKFFYYFKNAPTTSGNLDLEAFQRELEHGFQKQLERDEAGLSVSGVEEALSPVAPPTPALKKKDAGIKKSKQ